MSRSNKEYQSAHDYIAGLLSSGSVAVKAIRSEYPYGWRTVLKAKKDLGVKSVHTENGWAWYLPDVNPDLENPDAELPEIRGILAPGDEPEEDEPTDTARMIDVARRMHLDHHDSEDKIFKQLQADCRQYPQKPPYSPEHIRQVVNHVVFGHALPDRS